MPPSEGDEADGDVPDGVAIVRASMRVSLVAPAPAGGPRIRDVDLSRFIGLRSIGTLRRRLREYENRKFEPFGLAFLRGKTVHRN